MKYDSIATERLELVPVYPSFIHEVFEQQSKAWIMDFFQVDKQGFDKLLTMHKKGVECYSISIYYFLVRLKDSQTTIGECGFHTWNTRHHRAELFYSLRKDEYKRKGYMTEALPKVLAFGFNEMNLHRAEALVANWNEPSLRLLKQHNFTFEGTMREDYYWEGKQESSDCYSLLKGEWIGNG